MSNKNNFLILQLNHSYLLAMFELLVAITATLFITVWLSKYTIISSNSYKMWFSIGLFYMFLVGYIHIKNKLEKIKGNLS